MIYNDVNIDNWKLFAAQHYKSSILSTTKEFNSDLNKLKNIKKMFNEYLNCSKLDERRIINNLIQFYNVFNNKEAATRILFYRFEPKYWSLLKTFLVWLRFMPEMVNSVNAEPIISSDIKLEDNIVGVLRAL